MDSQSCAFCREASRSLQTVVLRIVWNYTQPLSVLSTEKMKLREMMMGIQTLKTYCAKFLHFYCLNYLFDFGLVLCWNQRRSGNFPLLVWTQILQTLLARSTRIIPWYAIKYGMVYGTLHLLMLHPQADMLVQRSMNIDVSHCTGGLITIHLYQMRR